MLKDNIQVAKGFQTSVNIAYDLHDDNKVQNFIPTMSSLDIIEDVLLSTAPNSTDRARILIGAYGRGKSHIILVLLSMLFKKDKALYSRLLEKMQMFNPELYEYTKEYLESSRKLLPIVVSGSSSSLTQSFLFALQQALNNENLNDIMPDTHFKASLNAIESWKADYPETYKQFLVELGTPIDDYIISLKEYSVEAYETFIELYPKLTAGSTFNPFLGFDVVELYEKVVDKLSDKGYEGVYIIYDEFSKYLESSIGNATISDIKLLQDFAEKCARSGKKQMHLMLICHKDISNYIDNQLPKEKVDGWRGVSGRFKHTNLHNNFAQMYEIISAVIKKDPAFWDSFVTEHKAQFEELEKKYTTNGLIDNTSAEGVRSAIYGCYPLHPVSTFILPRLSEKVAQNERTLFTFLSSEDIAGVEFEIRDKDGKVIETVVTDKDGHAESKELPICIYNEDGSFKEDIHYYVVETKAAEGYILDETVHDVVLQYDDNAPECVEYTLSLTNKPTEPKLPQTGDNFNPWLYAGLGLGALALGLFAAFWKKKEDGAEEA